MQSLGEMDKDLSILIEKIKYIIINYGKDKINLKKKKDLSRMIIDIIERSTLVQVSIEQEELNQVENNIINKIFNKNQVETKEIKEIENKQEKGKDEKEIIKEENKKEIVEEVKKIDENKIEGNNKSIETNSSLNSTVEYDDVRTFEFQKETIENFTKFFVTIRHDTFLILNLKHSKLNNRDEIKEVLHLYEKAKYNFKERFALILLAITNLGNDSLELHLSDFRLIERMETEFNILSIQYQKRWTFEDRQKVSLLVLHALKKIFNESDFKKLIENINSDVDD